MRRAGAGHTAAVGAGRDGAAARQPDGRAHAGGGAAPRRRPAKELPSTPGRTMLTVAAVIDFLEQFAPVDLAAGWDNVGLLLGDRAAPVERVLTCLTVTPESAGEAVQ